MNSEKGLPVNHAGGGVSSCALSAAQLPGAFLLAPRRVDSVSLQGTFPGGRIRGFYSSEWIIIRGAQFEFGQGTGEASSAERHTGTCWVVLQLEWWKQHVWLWNRWKFSEEQARKRPGVGLLSVSLFFCCFIYFFFLKTHFLKSSFRCTAKLRGR